MSTEKLPAVEYKPTEENEEEIFKIRAKLFRFDTRAEPPEWKERGTGEVKFLRHMKKSQVRLLMRRDKTHKVCANHFITKEMALLPNAGSDKAWVWTVQADYADEQPKVEQLAIKFKNAENAQKFKEQFVQCQDMLSTPDVTSALTDKMANLEVDNKEKQNDSPVPSGALDLYKSDDYWILSASTVHHGGQERRVDFNLESVNVGQSVACCISKDGELHYYIDGQDQGAGWTGVPMDRPLWGFADIYGLAKKIKSEFVYGELCCHSNSKNIFTGALVIADELMSCGEDSDADVTG
eukprot:Em0305g7a